MALTENGEQPTLANGVLPGAGYLHLNRPVSVPCRITLSPDTDHSESVAVYLCSDDEIPVVQLGYGQPYAERVHTAYAHAAGSPVRVEDETPSRGEPMIHVAITCALNSASTGRFCPALEDRIRPEDAAAWHAAIIAEHRWTVDAEGCAYCPRHNPNDAGTPMTLTSEGYLPIGESGWEARVPHNPRCDVSFANIEIRLIREGDDV